jgi:hypothetical protein
LGTTILTAIISATVSLTVTLITVFATRSTIKAEREKFERELQRSMTIKLYDARMAAYPQAMEITEGLRNSRLAEQGENLAEDYFKDIITKLDEWHATNAAFIMSRNSLGNLYTLRRALREKPESDGKYSSAQIKKIWDTKAEFRSGLRADIQLLFKEEEMQGIQED